MPRGGYQSLNAGFLILFMISMAHGNGLGSKTEHVSTTTPGHHLSRLESVVLAFPCGGGTDLGMHNDGLVRPRGEGCPRQAPWVTRAMIDGLKTLLTSVAALAGIVGVILLIGRGLRHTSLGRQAGSGRLLIVKDSIALDARRRLHLIQHGDRCVLLLTGGASDIVVGWTDGSKQP